MAKKHAVENEPDTVTAEVVVDVAPAAAKPNTIAGLAHVPRPQRQATGFALFDPGRWAVLKEQCGMLLQSNFFPAHFQSVEQVVAVAMIAHDLGIPLTTALQDIYIEARSRKPSTSTKLLLALVKRHPDYQWHSFEGSDETQGVFTIKVNGNPKPEIYRFTLDDARAQQLLNKDNWKKLLKIMLKWRAASIGIREQLPDIWLGYTHEELRAPIDVDQDGDIVLADYEPEVRAGTPAGPGAPAAQAVSPRSAQPPGPSAAPTRATPITTAAGGPATQIVRDGEILEVDKDRAKTNPLMTEPGPGPRPVPFDEWLEQNAAAGMVEQLTATHLRICLSNKLVEEQERMLAIQYILAAKDKQTACAKMVERLKQLAEEREGVDDDLRHIQPRTHAHRTVRRWSR